MLRLKYLLQQQYERHQAPPELAPDPATMEKFLSFCQVRHYRNKTTIIQPDSEAKYLYYVIDGSVAVCSEDNDGRELIHAYINRGQFIGEAGLFVSQSTRESLVRTRTDCQLAEISYEKLFRLFNNELQAECPKLLFAMGFQLTQRLLRTTRQANRMAFMDVQKRIARTLVDLCDEPDAMTHPDGTLLRISRVELCRIASCSREMVGRVLKRLEEEGMISVSGKNIVILGTR